MTDLTKTIAELRRDGPTDAPWTASLVADGRPYPSSLAGAVATILNAVVSGDLLPRADADLTAALMVEKAADIIGMCDQVGADAEGPVRALAPASALAEMQALRSERDRLDAVANTLSEMWEGEQTARHSAEAELVTLRAQVERLTGALRFYADFHENPNDGPWGINSQDFGKEARAALTEGAAP